jgi:hypothetical protein
MNVKVEFKEIESANENLWQYVPQSERLNDYVPAPMKYVHAVDLVKYWVVELNETVELTFEYSDGYRDTRTIEPHTFNDELPRLMGRYPANHWKQPY